ncbi:MULTISPECIES: hypothetical protein [Pseudomonas]|uniref:hypothetical protein n=1 Tax=Pseudomonas TaxID=286 RepID=UPI0007615E27|nr:hypothetical protein [Pseudomonas sp. NBRC 111140]
MKDLTTYLSPQAVSDLAGHNAKAPFVSDWLTSRITAFNRSSDNLEGPTADAQELNRMRQEITLAIDKFEAAINEILIARRTEEEQVRRWVLIVGIVLIILVIGSAVAPFLSPAANTAWITTLMSGLSVAGLLYLLYSPVHKLIDLARERSGLMILPSTFRIRVLAASTREEQAQIAKELFNLLQKPTFTEGQ